MRTVAIEIGIASRESQPMLIIEFENKHNNRAKTTTTTTTGINRRKTHTTLLLLFGNLFKVSCTRDNLQQSPLFRIPIAGGGALQGGVGAVCGVCWV